MARFANIIVDISLEKLDKTFQYQVPPGLEHEIQVGMQVKVPFGRRTLTGFVLELTDEIACDPQKLKPIMEICKDSVQAESQLIELAEWMRKHYGGTLNQALKTVLPVKEKTKAVERKILHLAMEEGKAREMLGLFEAKRSTAKARLLRALLEEKQLEYTLVTQKLGVTAAVIRALEEKGILTIETRTSYRNPVSHLDSKGYHMVLNPEQQRVVDTILLQRDIPEASKVFLLKGVTGSGKTEVYMELISHVIAEGKQAIVLIPEIALTYQTVMRFYNRFGNQVSILNSRMTKAERYDQYLRAKNGEIAIMIGPRSALFTPFSNLGMIIIDEEHETSYKSETVPKYHARETAIFRAAQSGAITVLGSATPTMESYYLAKEGCYTLLELKERVKQNPLPRCEVIDLRQELRQGNRSILSERLQELMEDRLKRGQQTMLFLNRRGLTGVLSCRACGQALKCPHCDVTLSQHNNGKMICHYCGYEEPTPKVCPSCGSKYLGGFKAGTQKIEELVQRRFPTARILRMDYDTTRKKDGYEKILSAFANQEADILIGTQMIVKGHDFPNVTLVGVLAADMSLHVNDYHGAERTFSLLTQAAGRAGRGDLPGEVVIQSYDPEHYAIQTAKEQNYEAFYEREISYRRLMHYPPIWNMLVVLGTSENYQELSEAMEILSEQGQKAICTKNLQLQAFGPTDPSIGKMNDLYRKVLYIKGAGYQDLIAIKDYLEKVIRDDLKQKDVSIQFDFNPMNGV